MDIKISAIIPCYNVQRELLFQCVNSILQQDFKEYEIIIVDDGSEEQYADFLEEVAWLDSRVRILRQNNRGVSAARNTGVRNAKGEYITFIDADDLVVPFFFAEAYRVATENGADFVVGGVLYTQSRAEKVPQKKNPFIEVRTVKQYRPSLIAIRDKFEGSGYFSRGSFARLMKRNIAANVFFLENIKLGEDVIWNLDVVSKCERIYMVYQIWYIYWENPASVTHKYNDHIIQLCEMHLEELNQRINWQDEKEAEAYVDHVFELLSSHVFRCYLGNEHCPLSRTKKRHVFRDLCKKETWTLYQGKFSLKQCSAKTRIRHLLIRSGLLYQVLSARECFRKSK